MMNRETADHVLAMLRGKKATGIIGRRALREFPELAPLGRRLGARQLDRARARLERWMAATIARKPIPEHVRGLWLSVQISVDFLKEPPRKVRANRRAFQAWARSQPKGLVPTATLEPYRETAWGADWELLPYWYDTAPWEARLLATEIEASSALEELALVTTAALLRDVAVSKPTFLTRAGEMLFAVRPTCAGETFTIGSLRRRGFDPKDAHQELW
jgi:hypothetical protein